MVLLCSCHLPTVLAEHFQRTARSLRVRNRNEQRSKEVTGPRVLLACETGPREELGHFTFLPLVQPEAADSLSLTVSLSRAWQTCCLNQPEVFFIADFYC